ncbi:MAG: DUF4920 domain-containing protein [Saprospiraceae bacterium]|nr:DUF4920 domain-containing protein [Saprospiraceae bacterium]
MKILYKSCFIALAMVCISPFVNAQEDKYQSFGDEINPESAISVANLLAALEGQDSVQAKVEGQINNVCQVKGCWMNISDESVQDPVFVQFKDYAFFVPKDAAGKNVIIEGIAYREMTSVEDLQHFAKDAGKSEEEIAKITEPVEEIRFMAKGVLIKS